MSAMGLKLRQLRQDSKLTLAKMAEEIVIPVFDPTGEVVDFKSRTGSFYSSIEQGRKTDLEEELIIGICDYFKISVEEFKLLSGVKEEEEEEQKEELEVQLTEEVIKVITPERAFITVPVIGGPGNIKRSSIIGVNSWEYYMGTRTFHYGLLLLTDGHTVKTMLPIVKLNELLDQEGII